MADFARAFERTLGHEGGWSDDPLDRGGMTWKGIARHAHPEWAGWRIIDVLRMGDDFPHSLSTHEDLNILCRQFYERAYWQRVAGQEIDDQAVAEELFDTAVNCGVRRAVRFLQESLNALNRDGLLYPDVTEDGTIGAQTLSALRAFLGRDSQDYLLALMNGRQLDHYYQITRRDPTQERFLRGWLRRTNPGRAESA